MTTTSTPRIAIIGGGPAGLMAAEVLSANGIAADIYDQMPSIGRKLLMAGKSGLNISHTEEIPQFLRRYLCDDFRFRDVVSPFTARDIKDWMEGLGVEWVEGPTGRLFPKAMKASPLLRAWLARLDEGGVRVHKRHRWTGWADNGGLSFDTPDGALTIHPEAVIFATGGASWRRLGSDGQWAGPFTQAGVPLADFAPSNGGFLVQWSDHMRTHFGGAAVKSVRLTINKASSRGEFVITKRGIEGTGVYELSAPLREALNRGPATLSLDLVPDLTPAQLRDRLARPRGKQSLGNHLRKALKLSPVKRALLNEFTPREVMADSERLATVIKALPITVTAPAPMDDAISTAGGVRFSALNDGLMITDMPGVFCAGEMLDFDAPTGGYLLTACMATGRVAGLGAADWLHRVALPSDG
ncbi:TIGR03862 family flavoprotein [Parvularcula sp. LCG005]|uniref:TIGR03862 family flavoprotein n=1 Tax=Parvularcula sp. LCG005 TaxID=3078805 RepID=UPI0029424BA3|nr:TIGR03862 family flavoprotein [Parvularcula sp. LCG005]WOI53747.1 TIGR03862 family flavoprotein [Parvularcula sp. LCG005]